MSDMTPDPRIDTTVLLALCEDETFDVVPVPPATLRVLVESYRRHQGCVWLSIEESRAALANAADLDAARADLARRDAALDAVTAWADEDDHHLSSCAVYLPFPTGTEPECSCDLRHLRAAITDAMGAVEVEYVPCGCDFHGDHAGCDATCSQRGCSGDAMGEATT